MRSAITPATWVLKWSSRYIEARSRMKDTATNWHAQIGLPIVAWK